MLYVVGIWLRDKRFIEALNIFDTITQEISIVFKEDAIKIQTSSQDKIRNLRLDGNELGIINVRKYVWYDYDTDGTRINDVEDSIILIGKNGNYYKTVNQFGVVRVFTERKLIDLIESNKAVLATARISKTSSGKKYIDPDDKELPPFTPKKVNPKTQKIIDEMKSRQALWDEVERKAKLKISKLKMIGALDKYINTSDDGLEEVLIQSFSDLKSGILYVPKEVTLISDDILSKLTGEVTIIGPGKLLRLYIPNSDSTITRIIVKCNVESYTEAFSFCSELKQAIILDSKTTELDATFKLCKKLEEVYFINVDTSTVSHMRDTFNCCTSLKYIDISCFDTHNTRAFQDMFRDCSSLKELDLSNFRVSYLCNFDGMLYGVNLKTVHNEKLDPIIGVE